MHVEWQAEKAWIDVLWFALSLHNVFISKWKINIGCWKMWGARTTTNRFTSIPCWFWKKWILLLCSHFKYTSIKLRKWCNSLANFTNHYLQLYPRSQHIQSWNACRVAVIFFARYSVLLLILKRNQNSKPISFGKLQVNNTIRFVICCVVQWFLGFIWQKNQMKYTWLYTCCTIDTIQ